jgi:hypothetical protein
MSMMLTFSVPPASSPRNNMAKEDRKKRLEEAEAREAAWRALSPKEQLAALDARLGKGQGAKKQRARIAAALKAGA